MRVLLADPPAFTPAYDHALAGMLPLTVDWLIEAQREAIRKAYERIAALDGQS